MSARDERHHRARYDDATVELARQLHDEGCGPAAIARGMSIRYDTICDWIYYRTRTGGECRRTGWYRRKQEAA